MGALNAYYANQRGRDPVAWFMIGIPLGLFGLVILFLLPKLNDKNSEKKETAAIAAEFPSVEELLPDYTVKEWYYLDDEHKQKGPVQFSFLKGLWHDGQLLVKTYVWCDGMDVWEKVENVPNLQELLSKEP